MPRPSNSHEDGCLKKSAEEVSSVVDHRAGSASIRKTSEAQVLAFDSGSSTTRIVGVSSTARRKRNQTSSGTWPSTSARISLRSRAMKPKPPPCKSRSVARKVCSMFRHRTQSNCFSSTPAASAECGSKASHPSISAQASARAVLAAKAENSKLVRPEQAGPKISVSAPRGKPPASESISAMPVETVSTTWRSRYVNGAATRPARASSTLERKVARFAAITDRGEEIGDLQFSLFLRLRKFSTNLPWLSTLRVQRSSLCEKVHRKSKEGRS